MCHSLSTFLGGVSRVFLWPRSWEHFQWTVSPQDPCLPDAEIAVHPNVFHLGFGELNPGPQACKASALSIKPP